MKGETKELSFRGITYCIKVDVIDRGVNAYTLKNTVISSEPDSYRVQRSKEIYPELDLSIPLRSSRDDDFFKNLSSQDDDLNNKADSVLYKFY